MKLDLPKIGYWRRPVRILVARSMIISACRNLCGMVQSLLSRQGFGFLPRNARGGNNRWGASSWMIGKLVMACCCSCLAATFAASLTTKCLAIELSQPIRVQMPPTPSANVEASNAERTKSESSQDVSLFEKFGGAIIKPIEDELPDTKSPSPEQNSLPQHAPEQSDEPLLPNRSHNTKLWRRKHRLGMNRVRQVVDEGNLVGNLISTPHKFTIPQRSHQRRRLFPEMVQYEPLPSGFSRLATTSQHASLNECLHISRHQPDQSYSGWRGSDWKLWRNDYIYALELLYVSELAQRTAIRSARQDSVNTTELGTSALDRKSSR